MAKNHQTFKVSSFEQSGQIIVINIVSAFIIEIFEYNLRD